MPKLRLKRTAEEQLHQLSVELRVALDAALLQLAANPTEVGVPLRGIYAGRWRMAVSGFRIIYRIREDGNLVIVDAIRRRDHRTYARRGS